MCVHTGLSSDFFLQADMWEQLGQADEACRRAIIDRIAIERH